MAQYWVKEIYLGLMKRRPGRDDIQNKDQTKQKTNKSNQKKDANNDSSEEGEEVNLSGELTGEKPIDQAEIEQQKPKEVQELLTKVNQYLMLHQFMTPNSDRAGFIDIFLVSMLRRGELQLIDLVEDSEKTKDFKNI